MNERPRPDLSQADASGLADLLAEGLKDSSGAGVQNSTAPSGEGGSSGTVGAAGLGLIGPTVRIPGYQVVREIGRGGMGRVYEAVQLSTQRTVALKVMLEGTLASETARRRFEREVRIAAGLRHPNIAQVYESGLHEGRYWFSMELVTGKALDVAADAAKLGLEQRLALMAGVCEAVGHAHERGVVHRDLKPSNILVSDEGQPHVLDFGLARVDDARREQELTLSMPGELMGTPAYMSPEQAGREPAEVDVRTDVYSLGVVLYRLLTGQFPYNVQGRLDEVVHEIATAEPTPPSRVNRQVDDESQAIILKALAKNPDERYASAAVLAKDLRRHLAGEPVEAKLASRTYRLTKRLLRQRRWLLPAGLSIAVIVLGVLAVRGLTEARDRTRARPVEAVGAAGRDSTTGVQVLAGAAAARDLAPMPEPVSIASAAWLDGKLHVIGGESQTCTPRKSHFVYDPAADAWTSAAPLHVARSVCGVTVAAGKLYAIGGVANCDAVHLSAVEAYDPGTNEWALCSPLPVALRGPGVASVGGKVYVVGGEQSLRPDGEVVPLGQTYVYDPESDNWTKAAVCPGLPEKAAATTIRVSSAAALGTKVYVVGGHRDVGLTLASYETRSGEWRPRGSLPVGLVDSPQVLALGDMLAVVPSGEIEQHVPVRVYSPASAEWYEVDTSQISYHGRSITALAAHERGFYAAGGAVGVQYRADLQDITCAAALEALAKHLAPSPLGEVLLASAFDTNGPLGLGWRTTEGRPEPQGGREPGTAWAMSNGALLVRMDRKWTKAHALYPVSTWTDYAVECEFQHESAKLAFLFRVDVARGVFYELELQHEQSWGRYHDWPVAALRRGYFLTKDDPLDLNQRESKTLFDCDYLLARDREHKLRIEVRGRTMRAYIDSVLLLAAEDRDGEPILSGGIGFGAETGCFVPCVAEIRNLRVAKLAD